MNFSLGIFVFIFLVCLSIALHEFGHFYFAKKFGAYVTEFMIGFGKVLYSKKVGETTYGIKLFLLGGYVKILGMFFPGHPNRKTHNRKGQLTLVELARQSSIEQLHECKQDRAFYRLSIPKKIIVLLAGPCMNLFLCVIAVILATNILGLNQATTSISNVPKCFDQVAQPKNLAPNHQKNTQTTDCKNLTPAFVAGITKGDKVLKIDGKNVEKWTDVSKFLSAPRQKNTNLNSHELVIDRNGQTMIFNVVPSIIDGQPKIGISPQFERERMSFIQSAMLINEMATQTFNLVLKLPLAVYELGHDWYVGKERSANSVASIVGVAKISGDIADSNASFVDKVVGILMVFASLNMALFIFNLIPLTPLDGGHIATCLWEGLRRTYSKLTGKNNYTYADNAKMMPLTYGVVIVLLAMTFFLVIVDIYRPLGI